MGRATGAREREQKESRERGKRYGTAAHESEYRKEKLNEKEEEREATAAHL